MRRPAAIALAAAGCSFGRAGIATAHELIPGVTGFASELLHPFAAVETVLVMLAAALAFGAAERPRALAVAALVSAAGIAAGVLAQRFVPPFPGLWRLPLLVALALAAVVAAGRQTGTADLLAVALLSGVALGLGATPEMPGSEGIVRAWAATALAQAAPIVLIAWPRAASTRPLVRLAGRIAGAWIAAIAILGLAVPVR